MQVKMNETKMEGLLHKRKTIHEMKFSIFLKNIEIKPIIKPRSAQCSGREYDQTPNFKLGIYFEVKERMWK